MKKLLLITALFAGCNSKHEPAIINNFCVSDKKYLPTGEHLKFANNICNIGINILYSMKGGRLFIENDSTIVLNDSIEVTIKMVK